MKFTVEQNNGYGRTKVSTFHDGTVHSLEGALASALPLTDEASVLRYAKENNITVRFGRGNGW